MRTQTTTYDPAEALAAEKEMRKGGGMRAEGWMIAFGDWKPGATRLKPLSGDFRSGAEAVGVAIQCAASRPGLLARWARMPGAKTEAWVAAPGTPLHATGYPLYVQRFSLKIGKEEA